ncbi:MAG: hypothetical protein AB2417_06115 [Clostridiaceae bacterium]
MKSKTMVALGLLGVLSLGGIRVSAETLKNAVPKNTLMTEKSITQSSNAGVDETKLKEIAKNAFEDYFNEKLDTNNLKGSMNLIKANAKWNSHGKDYYQIVWNNGDKDYYANVEMDGKIFDIAIIYKKAANSQKVTLIELEEAKKIAADFIREKNLVADSSELKFLGEATIGPETCGVVYEGEKGTGILVSVDSATKKVRGFVYKTLEDAKKAVELNDFRNNGILG